MYIKALTNARKLIQKTIAEKGLTKEQFDHQLNSISKNAPILNGKDGMIELDPMNPHHREWYEEWCEDDK